MLWNTETLAKSVRLFDGADREAIQAVEREFGVFFPEEYGDFLRAADGGQLTAGIILFSCGAGLHPAERLMTANANREADIPLFFVGRFAGEEFGFRKSDVQNRLKKCPIYVYLHEEGEIQRLSLSFAEFALGSL